MLPLIGTQYLTVGSIRASGWRLLRPNPGAAGQANGADFAVRRVATSAMARARQWSGIMVSIGIIGAAGRMGQAIADAALIAGARISGGIGRNGAVHGDHADVAALAAGSAVLVDFSTPDALAANLAAARVAGRPIVIGTT